MTGTFRFASLGKAMAIGETVGYIQIVADHNTDQVLGANMMGPHVTDLIHEMAVAIRHGITVPQIRRHHPRAPHHGGGA